MSGKSSKPAVRIESMASENKPLLGPELIESNGFSPASVRPPPDFKFYFVTSWVLFLEGLSGISGLSVSYFYKNELKVDPATLTQIMSMTNLPWTCKPIYGFVSDAFPIFGYRRRPYIFIAGVIGSAAWYFMSTWVTGVWQGFTCMLIASGAIAVANVMAEALVVERAQGESQEFASHLQSVVWGAATIGGLISSYLSGWLIDKKPDHTGPALTDRQVFMIAGLLPFTLVFLAMFTPEKAVAEKGSAEFEKKKLQDKVKELYRTIMMPEIFYPTAFIFLLNATPGTGSAWFYFYSSKPPLGLGFSSTFLGTMNVVGSIASLGGIVLFQSYLKTVPFRPLLLWGTIICTALGISNLIVVFHWNRAWGIPDGFFCLGESAIVSVVGWVTTMPIIVLASRLCPEGMEGTIYALIMSINNMGGIISSQIGAALTMYLGVTATNLDNLWKLVLICNLSTLIPLVLIRWIPDGDPGSIKKPVSLRNDDDDV